ncbi:tRNA1(Val) (adenine(37)-N6)-methyltransferase [Palleronia caenipelagi]|uniref:Methyltransferase n=1 Tax=Palleronia caenipelagi TaxID=2489174 RepID=A0A547Q5N9_9RHOB|nr:methyltransferase domain-containing protein [Palleronia caenipelagi]TRD21702.1 methyltransferase [Palleronia caenipelagi]
MSIPDTELTEDAFLGGLLTLWQPRRGYRAGLDAVLLAASIRAEVGQSVLDMGCGVGTALLCLGRRVSGLSLTGLELQPDMAELARRNAERNGLEAEIVTGDIGTMPATLRQQRFDRIIANPPYYDRGRGTASPETRRETALGEALPLADWVAAGARRLEPRGTMTVIQKADRLPDLVGAMADTLGSLVIRPIAPRAGRDATLVLVEGVKSGRSPARIAAPILLHRGKSHSANAPDFAPNIEAVLRNGAALD